MSKIQIDLSPDLKRLRDEGYEVDTHGSHLLVRNVPYVNSEKEIRYGILVSPLELAAGKTVNPVGPGKHVVMFAGEHPCNTDGTQIAPIKHASRQQKLDEGLIIDHSFSNKPAAGYADYYEKMTRYIEIISAPARSMNDAVTAQTFKVISSMDTESVFCYLDTNSSRAGICAISNKLKNIKIGIIGVGGTGSYILDFVAKTPVREIHLFDGDVFIQHNAFRAPGAPSVENLEEKIQKADYYKKLYSNMHKFIYAHTNYISSSNVDQLKDLDFVFMSVDKGSVKKIVIDKLNELKIPFVDVGMGVEVVDAELTASVRVTSSTENTRGHVDRLISFVDGEDDAYSTNIQIAELNALNAAMAVIKWKKMCGFYHDRQREHNTVYTVEANMLLDSDHEV